jgi:hypothetical protein
MDLVTTRRIGIGVAGTIAEPALAVAGAGLRVAAFTWRTPLAAPLRRPAYALVDAAERRGERAEARLVLGVSLASSDRIARMLSGPLLDRAIRALIEARLLERLATEALEGESLERVLAIAAERGAAIRAADVVLADDSIERLLAHVLEQPAVDRVIERAIASPVFEQHVAAALDQPGLERVLQRALASRFAQAATEQILASDELLEVVSHIARSEAVREALQSQTHGLVDDVGDELRDRTAGVDDRMEGLARRLLRRKARMSPLAVFDEDPASA